MKVLNTPAPKNARDTIQASAAYQMIADCTVRTAGFKPVIHTRGITAPRVYVELTHLDTWTVKTNDPNHPELEELVADAIQKHIHCGLQAEQATNFRLGEDNDPEIRHLRAFEGWED